MKNAERVPDFIICTLPLILSQASHIKNDQAAGPCSARGGNVKCTHNFCVKPVREDTTCRNSGVYEIYTNIKKGI